MYAKHMEYVSSIISLLVELALLVRALFTDGTHFISLLARSRSTLAAENLFLRKQLAFYQERKIKPRRFDNVTRLMLVLLSHGFAWKEALVNVTAKTFIGWHRAGFRLFWRWKSRPGRPRIPAELRALISEMALSNALVVKKLIRIEISTFYQLLSVSQCLCVLPRMRQNWIINSS